MNVGERTALISPKNTVVEYLVHCVANHRQVQTQDGEGLKQQRVRVLVSHVIYRRTGFFLTFAYCPAQISIANAPCQAQIGKWPKLLAQPHLFQVGALINRRPGKTLATLP